MQTIPENAQQSLPHLRSLIAYEDSDANKGMSTVDRLAYPILLSGAVEDAFLALRRLFPCISIATHLKSEHFVWQLDDIFRQHRITEKRMEMRYSNTSTDVTIHRTEKELASWGSNRRV